MKLKKIALLGLLLSQSVFATDWECTNRVVTCHTWRMQVPEGWIVASENTVGSGDGYAITFVPDKKHEWKL
jgi:hypothetical protein